MENEIMNCLEIQKLSHQVIDDEISADQLLRFEAHVESCKDCKEHWNQLGEMKRMLRAIAKKAPAHSKHLQENILTSIKLESKREERRKRFLLSAIAAALIAVSPTVGLVLHRLAPQTSNTASLELEAVVAHYHNHSTMDKKELMQSKTRMVKKVMLDRVAMAKEAGFSFPEKQFKNFMLSSSEVIQQNGKKIARLCYKTSDLGSSTCVDCYFSPSGTLHTTGLTEKLIAGKRLELGRLAGNSVIIYKGRGLDTVFVSSLPQDKLLEMISSSPQNLS